MKPEDWKINLGVLNASRSSIDEPGKTGKFFDRIPVQKMYEQALHIEKDILPRIEKKSGKDNEDYKFFREIYRSLVWAIVVNDRQDWLQRKLTQSEVLLSIYKERCEKQEMELSKYTTMEDLIYSDALDHIATAVKNRVNNILKNS